MNVHLQETEFWTPSRRSLGDDGLLSFLFAAGPTAPKTRTLLPPRDAVAVLLMT